MFIIQLSTIKTPVQRLHLPKKKIIIRNEPDIKNEFTEPHFIYLIRQKRRDGQKNPHTPNIFFFLEEEE